MKEPKGLIEVINDKCCELYKNGMSEEEISEEVGISVIRVGEAIHGKLIDKIWRKNDMTNIQDLTEKIEKWAIDRNLHTADAKSQAIKLFEELGELAEGLSKNKIELIEDAIGDSYVVLTILAMQLDLDINQCIQTAYDEIKDRKGKMVNGVFVKEQDL